MLQMRPGCECCDRDLPADSTEAWICSFECTFCRDCVETKLAGRCPNCGGSFRQRPTRVGAVLARNPASTVRIHNPSGCAAVS
jgi:uncharacterized protein